jgi:hypothetical protein
VSGDEVVGEAGDGLARVRIAAALALFLSRASFFTGHRVGKSGWVRLRVVCASLWLEVERYTFRGFLRT